MTNVDAPPRSPVTYRMTLPIVLAFAVCMLSIYLLGQDVYRYGSWHYAQPEPIFSEDDRPRDAQPAVAVVLSTSQLE